MPLDFALLIGPAAVEQFQSAPGRRLLIYSEDWCAPCVNLKSMLATDERVGAYIREQGINVALADVDATPPHAERTKAIPLLSFYNDGRNVLRHVGTLRPEEFITKAKYAFSR